MSDHIAHLGICDDTFRLARLHPQVHEHFKSLFDPCRDDAHMGSVTRSADKWSGDVIVWAAQQHALTPDQRDPLTDRKLAFVLGSLTHRAADRLTKPITNCWRGNPDGSGDANESKIMQDICVWREVYGSGEGTAAWPFTPDLLTPLPAEGEALFRLLLRRALIAMHTLNPDAQNIHAWLDRFFKGLQTYPKSLELYAELAANWPEDKVKKYLVDKRFYQRDDPIIELARGIQHGQDATPEQVVAVVEATDASHSRYARALAKATQYLIAASDLFAGRIALREAQRLFDVGVPELSLRD
jgi:hypothetical protein